MTFRTSQFSRIFRSFSTRRLLKFVGKALSTVDGGGVSVSFSSGSAPCGTGGGIVMSVTFDPTKSTAGVFELLPLVAPTPSLTTISKF